MGIHRSRRPQSTRRGRADHRKGAGMTAKIIAFPRRAEPPRMRTREENIALVFKIVSEAAKTPKQNREAGAPPLALKKKADSLGRAPRQRRTEAEGAPPPLAS